MYKRACEGSLLHMIKQYCKRLQKRTIRAAAKPQVGYMVDLRYLPSYYYAGPLR
ncbi:MAG: hypothetical protein ACI910_001990 [Oleispira sp.]|jgi:hypothetical protein